MMKVEYILIFIGFKNDGLIWIYVVDIEFKLGMGN